MTDTTSDTESMRSMSLSLSRTVRRSEIIAHLNNFRVNVDKAIHALPGVILGVSCANVIQASIHLTWLIEQLKGALIEAMLRERINPFGDEEDRHLPPRFTFSHPHSVFRPEFRPGYAERESSLSSLSDEQPQPMVDIRRDPIMSPPTNRPMVPRRTFVAGAIAGNVTASNDQVVPSLGSTTYRNSFTYGSIPPFSTNSNSHQIVPENSTATDTRYSANVTSSQDAPRFGVPSNPN